MFASLAATSFNHVFHSVVLLYLPAFRLTSMGWILLLLQMLSTC